MRLSELMAGMAVAGLAGATEVSGIAHDSRRVRPGDLFVAFIGRHHDGRAFVPEAMERGAAAVLAPGPAPEDAAVPWLTADDPRRLLGPLAARFWHHPDRRLVMVGVTGTNGKSTVVAVVAAVLEAAGWPTGILGTLGYRFRDLELPGERTTPEASDLFATLARMREAGAAAVAMEVSSHALAQGRVAGAGFDVAVFTNLTRDHLDFHGDLEEYFQAKRGLFAQLKPEGRETVNVADPHGRRLAAELGGALTFGEGGEVAARGVVLDAAGIRGTIVSPRGEYAFASPLLGRFNLENLLAAAAAAEVLALPHAAVAAGFAARGPLPGRLEPVAAGQPFPVLVDYAHTEAALEAALASVRELTGKRIALVFGCGGDRDPGKRAAMGRVAGALADLPIVTSDNPRGEDPLTIIAAIEQGLRQSGNRSYRVVPDRREAIRRVVAVAEKGWVVLVAGKGHESVQVVGEEALPFSDRKELTKALEERFGSAARR